MLYIRADGNTDIGMGHVMRCLSVAEAAAAAGQEPVFITADEGCRSMIEERGFRVIVLHTDYKDMMSELSALTALFCPGDVLLVDSYQAGRAYYLSLRKVVKVACFEDMGQPYPVDLLINYNIYAPDLAQNYKAQQNERMTSDIYPGRVLLGVEYMPLRKAFQGAPAYKVSDKVKNVTITTGGSDPYFAADAFADVILKDGFLSAQGIRLHLVSGPFNRYAEELKRRYQACETVTIHENVKDMKKLLTGSDVVISATGSTIYEVSALGVPMIVFYFAENQRQGAEAFGKLTDIVNTGCFAKDGRAVAERAAQALIKCVCDKSYRVLLSTQERRLIDGKGASRIAEQLR